MVRSLEGLGDLLKPKTVISKILRNNVSGVGYVAPAVLGDDVAPLKAQRGHPTTRPFEDEGFVVGVVVELSDVEVEVVCYFLLHSFAHIAIRWRSLGNSVFMTSSLMHRLRNSVIFSSCLGVGIGIVYEVFELL